jgi:hypothetical protein
LNYFVLYLDMKGGVVRKPGNVRGRVLISYAEVSALVNRLSGEVAAK